jgi:hypothetical protein
MSLLSRRVVLGLACVIGLAPVLVGAGGKSSPGKTDYFKGEVVPLADLVARAGSRLDPDAGPHWLALVSDDGKVYPLVKDSGSRMFFKDPALLHRPMRLTGRLLPGSQVLQVVAVNSSVKGELHEVYYWCDVCSIRRSEKDVCECCGAPMVLHEDPVKK